jgi:hypothetical protein
VRGIAKEGIRSMQMVRVGFVLVQSCCSCSVFAGWCLMSGYTSFEKLALA